MTEENQDNNWSLPKFYFMVDWGSTKNIPFQEVSGLEIENKPLEYRHDNSKLFTKIKMPGIVKNGNITLKKGIFANDNKFWDWYNKIKMNTKERQNVVIKLLDEGGNPAMIWTLYNACPIKVQTEDLKADGNEVSIESIELAHEGLTIADE